MNKSEQKQSQLHQTRQIISARQLQKLAKDDNPVFLAIVRKTNEVPRLRGNKKAATSVARFAAAHGKTEGEKRKINKNIGSKKDFATVEEREQ